jgi:glutathione S-transferase
MAIVYSGAKVELRDILLKDKPDQMIKASPKATVPVLKLPDETVLEESLDIMLWALRQNDPDGWLPDNKNTQNQIFQLVSENDGPFKTSLDKYKYHIRFPEHSREDYRADGEVFLRKLEGQLSTSSFLLGPQITFADIAIFPFIRQFMNSDLNWFQQAPYPNLRKWLNVFLESDRFSYVMKKRPIWNEDTSGILFPEAHGV